MAFPTPIEILLVDQVRLIITGASAITRTDRRWYDNNTYRNLFPNQQVILNPVAVDDAGIATLTNTATLQVPGSVTGSLENQKGDPSATVGTNASKIIVDDSVAAIEPRPWEKVRTRVEFWETAGQVGQALQMSFTTALNSAEVTVPDNSLVTAGQAVTGTDIPAGTVVAFVPPKSPTKLILSQIITAAAGVKLATLTGGIYKGGYWADEELGDASSIAILQ